MWMVWKWTNSEGDLNRWYIDGSWMTVLRIMIVETTEDVLAHKCTCTRTVQVFGLLQYSFLSFTMVFSFISNLSPFKHVILCLASLFIIINAAEAILFLITDHNLSVFEPYYILQNTMKCKVTLISMPFLWWRPCVFISISCGVSVFFYSFHRNRQESHLQKNIYHTISLFPLLFRK